MNEKAMEILKVFDLDKEADAIEAAVSKVLKDGYRTIDIMSEGKTQIGTARMGDEIAANIQNKVWYERIIQKGEQKNGR